MTISVIIPTCDRNQYLGEALTSVVNQSRLAEEIIVVNNGRGKPQLPPALADKIKLIETEPYSGAACARNVGAERARGDYLAFLDDDDLWSSDYLAKVAEAINQGACCLISRLDLLDGQEIKPYKNALGKLTVDNLLVYNPGVTGSNIVVAKELFIKAGGFDEQLVTSEDKSLAIEIIKTGIEIVVLPDNQAIHRLGRQGQNLDSNPKKMAFGISRFTRKYSYLMNFRQRLGNWRKIYRYRYQAGQTLAWLPLAMLYLTNKIINFSRTEKH